MQLVYRLRSECPDVLTAEAPARGARKRRGLGSEPRVGGFDRPPEQRLIQHAPRRVSLDEASDELLVRRMCRGDRAAGERLVGRYSDALMRYLHRIAPHSHEDLYQQTWLGVFDHLNTFSPTERGGFKAWLYRIATNKAHDHWRARGREKAAKTRYGQQISQESPDASFDAQWTERKEELHRAMKQLPEHQREVLMLRYYANLKFVEVAEVLDCPLNTALGRVHKAMIKLRELMSAA